MMRFVIVAAALLSLISSVLATRGASTEFIRPNGGHKYECHKISKVNWKKFSFEKKTVWLVIKDKDGNELSRKEVEADQGETEMMLPEYYDKYAKFALVDTQTNYVFAEGQEITIDCPKNKRKDGIDKWDGSERIDGNDFEGDN